MPDTSTTANDELRQALISDGSVVCFGFLAYCLLLVVETYPSKNDGSPIREVIDAFGDDAAIVASILSRWKVPTTLTSSPVGEDFYGAKVAKQLRASGLAVDERVKSGVVTPLEVGIVDPSGSRTYFQRRSAEALLALEPPSLAQLSGARMLYVDWYDGPVVPVAIERARSQGVPVFLNLESRYYDNPQLPELLEGTNVCQVSMDEPGAPGEAIEIARTLIDRGTSTALVTMGANGCTVAEKGQAFFIRPPKVKVIDGYGAGAAFSAGVIYGLMLGWSLERVARFATAHSGLKCGVMGNVTFPIEDIQKVAAGLDFRTIDR